MSKTLNRAGWAAILTVFLIFVVGFDKGWTEFETSVVALLFFNFLAQMVTS